VIGDTIGLRGEGTAPAIFVKLFKGLKREPQRYEIEVKKV